MAIPGYDPIGALGGLFAPAYIAGDPEAMAAAEAWFQKHKKTPPKGDGYYKPPVRPDMPAEEKKDAIDKVTEALMKQPYYPDLQGGGVADPMGEPVPSEPLAPVPGYPTTNNPLPFTPDEPPPPDDPPTEPPAQPEPQTPPAQPPAKGQTEIAPDDINVNVDPITGEYTTGQPTAAKDQSQISPGVQTSPSTGQKGQATANAQDFDVTGPPTAPMSPLGQPTQAQAQAQAIADMAKGLGINDIQVGQTVAPGKSDLAPGPQTALSPPNAPTPVSPVAAPTVSPNMTNYGLDQIANPPTGFPAVSIAPPQDIIDPWGLSPDEIANNTPNVNAWGLTAPFDDLGIGLGIGKGGVPASQQLDKGIDAAKGALATKGDTDFSGQSKGVTLDPIVDALMAQAVPLDLDPVTGEPVVDTQAPVSLDIDYGYGDLAPVGDPVSVDLGDLAGGTGGVTDAPDGTESTGGPGAGGASSATAAEATAAAAAQAEAIGAMADALGIGDIGAPAPADAQSDLGGGMTGGNADAW